MTNGNCPLCGNFVPSNPEGMPSSKYWKSKFSSNLRIREVEIEEVYCCAAHGLEAYKADNWKPKMPGKGGAS